MLKSKTCIGQPADKWPHSHACIKRSDNRAIADAIWGLDEVVAWVTAARDEVERDHRACSLTTATSNALRNSGDRSNSPHSWETPAAHRNYYSKLAKRLEAAPTYPAGGKLLARLRRDLGQDKAAVFARSSEADLKDLAELSWAAREFAGAADDLNWTQPSVNHDDAARNTFICELTEFQCDPENNFGQPSHVMTSAIVCALFESGASAQDVERIARQRKKPPRRS